MRAVQWAVLIGLAACKPEDTGDTDDTASDVPMVGDVLDCGTLGSAGGLGPGTEMQRFDFDIADFPDALCNDGTPAFFYFRPHEGAADADHWVIQLQGGGSCDSPADCFERWCSVDTNFGMQGMSADPAPQEGINGRGILDRDVAAPNPLGDFNQVYVKYCSSDQWAGTARDVVLTAPHPVTGEEVTARLHFEGARIVDAVLATLRQDGAAAPTYTLDGGSEALPDLDDATMVVLAGASGGGAGTIQNADRMEALLRSENTGCQGATCDLSFAALIDSIFAPARENLDYSSTELCTELGMCDYETHYTAVHEVGSDVMQGAIGEDSCSAAHASDGDVWKCSDTGHLVRHHVTAPMFVRMGQTDQLISSNMIDAGFKVDGAPLDLQTFARLVREDLLSLTDPTNAEEGGAMSVAPGVYGPTCARHETLSDNPSVYEVTIDMTATPTHMYEAIAAWRAGTTPVAVISEGPADDYCPPQN